MNVFPDGSLGNACYQHIYKAVSKHPKLKYSFSNIKLPYVEKCDELVKACHPVLMHHRLLSWDICVDENGEAILIDTSLTLDYSPEIQIVCGPFFGSYTREVLNEVYGIGKDISGA